MDIDFCLMNFTYSRQPFLVDQLQELNNVLENDIRLQYKLNIILYIIQNIMFTAGLNNDANRKNWPSEIF